MKRIIFDNVGKGFPADENFMRLVDETQSAMRMLCSVLFGEERVILAGLEVERSTGHGNPIVALSEGYAWIYNDIYYVERQQFDGDVLPDHILIGTRQQEIESIYHNGEQLPAYRGIETYVVVKSNPGLPGVKLNSLTSFKRIKKLELID